MPNPLVPGGSQLPEYFRQASNVLVVNDSLSIPLREFEFSFTRSPGPGGQNVNKVNTKVVLRWDVAKSKTLPDEVRQRFLLQNRTKISKSGEFLVTSHRFRDQGRNVADCLNKLRERLLLACEAPKRRINTRPTRSAKKRRLESKRRQSEKKSARRPPRLDT